MFCTNCGVQNPDGAQFCRKCGRAMFPPDETTAVTRSGSTATAGSSSLPASGAQSAGLATRRGWVVAYGWLLIVAAGLLFIIAVSQWGALEPPKSYDPGSILFRSGLAPPLAEQQAEYERQQRLIIAELLQGLLFAAAGIAILIGRRKTALRLVWTSAVLGALGVVVRGITPLETLLWTGSLGLAIWYTRTQRLLPVEASGNRSIPAGTTPFKSSMNTTVVVIGAGCLALVTFALIGLTARTPREELARLNIAYDQQSFAKAAKNGDLAVVQWFLKCGMDPTNALLGAASGEQPTIVRLLLDKGADPNQGVPYAKSAKILRLFLERGADINKGDGIFTPLINAVVMEDLSQVQLFLDNGADPNVKDRSATPLQMAVLRKNSDIVRLLLDRGANVNLLDEETGRPPLAHAILFGNTENARILLERGSFVDAYDVRAAEQLGHHDLAILLKQTLAKRQLQSPSADISGRK
jgi:hypothetical protein